MLDAQWGPGAWLILFVVVQRLVELVYAHRNTVRLRAEGGTELGRSHYPLMVAIHALWLIALAYAGHDRAISLPWLVVFALLQVGRLWVIMTLGRRWTTRVIVLPGEALIARGPYRFIRHPNYLIVTLEIAAVPLALGLPVLAAVFSAANAAVLYLRIRVENAALAWAEGAETTVPAPGSTLANAGMRR